MSMMKCAFCEGTGTDGAGGSPCACCGADGFVKVPDPPTLCARCAGSGRAINQTTHVNGPCVGCRGTGWAT